MILQGGARVSGKTYVDEKAYRRFRDSGKLVHRWVAEKKVGGRIGPGRVVHHRDGNKMNNKNRPSDRGVVFLGGARLIFQT
jgi:hypothetical protein